MIRRRWLAMVCGGICSLLAPFALAATACDPWVAKMVSAQGVVEVRRAGQPGWQPARINDMYCPGDRIQVGERSRADVLLVNQPVLRLDQDTTITLGEVRERRTSLIELVRGALYFFSRLPRNLEVLTAFVNAGVEGTEGWIQVESDRTLLTIFTGRALALNQAGRLTVSDGESAVAERGQPPRLRSVVRPRDSVHWALYYPAVAYFHRDEFPPGPGWQGMIHTSLEAYLKGDLPSAFESLKGVPDSLGEARFFAYRATLLLAVGRSDQANRDIARALSLQPDYSEALALQAIIAVSQNEKARALEIAQQAVAADRRSASALIALSYARQAHFNLDGARADLQQAVRVAPGNALAWARLAELHLSLAELQDSLEAAKRAVALEPKLSRTHTVLGFVYLTQVDTLQAKTAFAAAIELDQADYLPRMGLGLARIREGDLPEGRRELEIAASLDPGNSIVRSYLGKAYFEEKRGALDEREYEIAKMLDPKDPTPWFYGAITKQTSNRPVEALHDLQRAIELNHDRAVYRSSLHLDSDLAARSASLGRIYGDLGFQQLALVEGWRSVNTDPANFSAHRFLADSYSVLPRHEIARVSELLQSQLLQPLNMTPIQPRLAESNLFLVGASGPVALGFNEFNPLFNRNGLNFQSTGLAGDNRTYAGEGVLSGIYQKASFSLGGFHFQTDGWRANAQQKDSIGNAFLQLELSPQASVQAEVRRRENSRGDLQQRFFPRDFFPGLSETTDSLSVRLGARHVFSADSIMLGSLIYQNKDSRLKDGAPVAPILTSVNGKLPQDAVSVELQQLFRSGNFNLTGGLGYSDIAARSRTAVGFIFPPPFDLAITKLDEGVKHFNIYSYANISLIRQLIVTGGVSFEHLRGDPAVIPGGRKKQFNPKFGITWNPLSGTSVRAGVSRVLKRTLITDQTLEPTQVAGFNQFFDDPNVAQAWRYGAAIDQKFTKDLYGGWEVSRRDLELPLIDISGPAPVTQELKGKEYQSRAYLFWTPHPWLGLRTEYIFERFKNDPLIGPARLATQRVPLAMSFFHPAGVSLSLSATYYHQSGKFFRLASGVGQSARDDFWMVNGAIHYRLPNRYGFVTAGAANWLDKKFKYFEPDLNNPSIQPGRMLYLRVTLALP